jgi:hypothetical protein
MPPLVAFTHDRQCNRGGRQLAWFILRLAASTGAAVMCRKGISRRAPVSSSHPATYDTTHNAFVRQLFAHYRNVLLNFVNLRVTNLDLSRSTAHFHQLLDDLGDRKLVYFLYTGLLHIMWMIRN